jgi:hypothetical protein
MMTQAMLDQALRALNQKSAYAGIKASLVVCGGAALIATGLIMRVTGDVDVLGSIPEETNEPVIIPLTQIPVDLEQVAADVGHDLGLEPDWLNVGPAVLHEWGFPEGLESRLIRKHYGNFLTVFFIGRLDQVHFKILAAMDPTAGPRHLHDLLELEPTAEEARAAVRWVLRRETSAEFRRRLANVLERIGHERLAGEF